MMQNIDAKNLYKENISHINVGSGQDLTIKELSEIIKNIVGFTGEIIYDNTKPDGMLQKLLDVKRINQMGWTYKTPLKEGIKKTYEWFCKNHTNIRI